MSYRGMPAKLRARARPRRLRLYVVGSGHTGTMTMTRVFGRYRSAHEIDAVHILPVAAAAHRGQIAERRARWALRRRNLRFSLEVDSASFLSPFVSNLAELYPDARFLVLIRDCFSWLDSSVEHNARRSKALPGGKPAHWVLWGDALFGDRGPYEPEDRTLQAKGMPSVGAYMRYWAKNYSRLLAEAPRERTLILRTEDIDWSRERLARFCGLDPSSLEIGVRANVAPYREGILAGVAPNHVLRHAEQHCAVLMERFWGPGWRELVGRVGAWELSSDESPT